MVMVVVGRSFSLFPLLPGPIHDLVTTGFFMGTKRRRCVDYVLSKKFPFCAALVFEFICVLCWNVNVCVVAVFDALYISGFNGCTC